MPAKTGSIANAIAVREALICRCAQVWTRKPSALAKIPVTSSAPHTVHPRGTSTWPSATATAAKPANAASISTCVNATGS